jgi:hypothetical protein
MPGKFPIIHQITLMVIAFHDQPKDRGDKEPASNVKFWIAMTAFMSPYLT